MNLKRYIHELSLLLVAIVWGSGFVTTRYALNGGLSTAQINTLRFTLAAIILFLLFRKKIIKGMNRSTVKYGLILGVLLASAFYAMTLGLVYTTGAKNAFITSTNVVIVPFIGFIFYKRPLNKKILICSLMALAGIAVLSLEKDVSVNKGDVLTLVCAFIFAFHIFYTSVFSRRCDTLALTLMQFVGAAIVSLVVQIFQGEIIINAQPIGWFGVLMLTFLSTILGFVLQTKSSKYLDGTKVSLIMSTESVFGTIFSFIFLGEPITLKILFGSILIFTAIVISEIDFDKRKRLRERDAHA